MHRSEDFLRRHRPTLWCCVCGGGAATLTVTPLNGLPAGVASCQECRDAVRRREVGVVIFATGSLYVTDGRRLAA